MYFNLTWRPTKVNGFNISPPKFYVIWNSFYTFTSGKNRWLNKVWKIQIIRKKCWDFLYGIWLKWGSCVSKIFAAALLFVLQRWATSSWPAVPRGQQRAANCVSCARETAPGPTRSLTMTTPEPSSQYQSFFDAFHCRLSASTHLSSKYDNLLSYMMLC